MKYLINLKSEKDRDIEAVALRVHGEGLFSFHQTSKMGIKYWETKHSKDFGDLVDKYIEDHKRDRAWCEMAINSWNKYHEFCREIKIETR